LIRKRGKKFEVSVYSPAVRRKVYVGTFAKRGTATELGTARHAEVEAEREFHEQGRVYAGTVASWAQRWLVDYPRPEVTTNRHNEANLRLFLAEFGERRLDRITKAEAKRVVEQRLHVAKTASAMFNDAIRYLEGYRAGNPFEKLITEGRGRQDITPLTEDEVRRLGAIAVESYGLLFGATFRAVILFAAWTGCRPGELAGMRWDDLDLEAGTVLVERQRRPDGLARTKTKRSREPVVPAEALDAVQSTAIRDDEWLFVTPNGRPFSKGSWGYYWRPVRDAFTRELDRSHWLPRRLELDLADKLDFYELRHFCGSLLADRGCSARDIAEQLGNSERVCEQVYIHPYRDRVRARVRAAFEQAPVDVGGNQGGDADDAARFAR
jgi:integrase